MGTFFKSFWGQMGRSTGKRMSNALYGDKWSTPYRMSVNKQKQRKDESRRGRPRKSERISSPPNYRGKSGSKSRSANKGCLIWIVALTLFAGTYNVILNPTKEEVLLIVMLWIVAIVFFLFRYFRPRK